MVDFLFFHEVVNPRRRFILPKVRRLPRVDSLNPGVSRRGDQRRGITNERLLVEGAARLVVLHIPNEQHRTARLRNFAQINRYLSAFEFNHRLTLDYYVTISPAFCRSEGWSTFAD